MEERVRKKKQEVPEVNQHGWGVIDGTYKSHWIDNQSAPEEVSELVFCDCKKGNVLSNVLLQVLCTYIYKCKGECQNEVPASFSISDEELE